MVGITLEAPTIKIIPKPVYLQKDEHNIFLNFDFQIHGCGREFFITTITLSTFDKKDNLVVRKSLDSNGAAPGILTLPQREIPREGVVGIFNPFHSLDATVDIAPLEYIFHLTTKNKDDLKLKAQVMPVHYSQRANLRLPFDGDFIVYDGNDYYSHHRRVPLSDPLIRQMKIEANSGRYAYDFCAIDENGNLCSREPIKNEDYSTFGKPVHCLGDGVVVEVADGIKDNVVGKPQEYSFKDFIENPKLLAGNHIVIEHYASEYSVIGHCKQHSIKVRTGDKVFQGQILGLAGNSGSSGIPHIHYQLQNCRNLLACEGLPCVFDSYDIMLGSNSKHILHGFPKTGERLRNKF